MSSNTFSPFFQINVTLALLVVSSEARCYGNWESQFQAEYEVYNLEYYCERGGGVMVSGVAHNLIWQQDMLGRCVHMMVEMVCWMPQYFIVQYNNSWAVIAQHLHVYFRIHPRTDFSLSSHHTIETCSAGNSGRSGIYMAGKIWKLMVRSWVNLGMGGVAKE